MCLHGCEIACAPKHTFAQCKSFLQGTLLVTDFTNLCKHTDKLSKRQIWSNNSIKLRYCYSSRRGTENISVTRNSTTIVLNQGSQTRGPRTACGSRGPFVRPAVLFGNFQISNISVAKCFEKRCHEIIESNLNDTQYGFRPGRGNTDHISLSSKILRNIGTGFFFKENVRYPVWTCRDPISLILGTDDYFLWFQGPDFQV